MTDAEIRALAFTDAQIKAMEAQREEIRAELAKAASAACRCAAALESQPCRCRCMAHGHGCGLQEATCHKDDRYKCNRCAALYTVSPCAHATDAERLDWILNGLDMVHYVEISCVNSEPSRINRVTRADIDAARLRAAGGGK